MIGGKKLIPAPLVSISRVVERNPDQTSKSKGYNITLTGTLVAMKGSPDYTGAFWTLSGYPPDTPAGESSLDKRLAIFRNKIRALTDLVETEGIWLELQPWDNTAPLKCQPLLNRITFDQGPWTDVVRYTIDYFTDNLYGLADSPTLDRGDFRPEESWSLEPADETGRLYRLTHTVSCSAPRRFTNDGEVEAEGWEVARAMILGSSDPDHPTYAGTGATSLLGFNQAFLTSAGALDLSTFLPYDYTRSVQVDKASGRYSVTETWRCVDPAATQPSGQSAGKALEELVVETRYSNENGLSTVTVNGTVTGLEERHPTTWALQTSRWANAEARFGAITDPVKLSIAEAHSGLDLNPAPLSFTLSRNKVSGVLQWTVSYDTRPAVTDGYLSESYELTIDYAADVFASIGVIGRLAGPVLQAMGSKTEKSATMNASIVVGTAYGQALPSKPVYDPLPGILSNIGSYTQLFLRGDRESFTPLAGRYNRSTTVTFQ